MGVEKKVLQDGNNVDFPKKGDVIAMHYTGCLYDSAQEANHFMGKKYALSTPNLSHSILTRFCIDSTAPRTPAVASLFPPPLASVVSSRVRTLKLDDYSMELLGVPDRVPIGRSMC